MLQRFHNGSSRLRAHTRFMKAAPLWGTNKLAHCGARKAVCRGATPYFIYLVMEAAP